MHSTLIRVRDFFAMGVPKVWIFDPESRTVQVCSPAGSTRRTDDLLQIPRTPCELSLTEAFIVLKRA